MGGGGCSSSYSCHVVTVHSSPSGQLGNCLHDWTNRESTKHHKWEPHCRRLWRMDQHDSEVRLIYPGTRCFVMVMSYYVESRESRQVDYLEEILLKYCWYLRTAYWHEKHVGTIFIADLLRKFIYLRWSTRLRNDFSSKNKDTASGVRWATSGVILQELRLETGHSSFLTPCIIYRRRHPPLLSLL